MKSLWTKLKDKVKKFLKANWELKLAYTFSYLIPLLLIGEYLAFTDEVEGGTKLAIGGMFFGGGIFIITYKKIKEKILRLKKGITRGILRIINTALFWSVVFGIIYVLDMISIHLYDYWIKVGVCFIIGHIFFMKDEIRKGKENKMV